MKKIISIFLIFLTGLSFSQTRFVTVNEAVALALQNNERIKTASYALDAQRQLKKTSLELPKTDVSLMYGQYNSFATNDNNLTVTQSIPFSIFGSQASLNRELITSKKIEKSATENEVVYQVKKTCYQLMHANARQKLLLRQDSIFNGFLKSADLRYKSGETNFLEKTSAEVQRNEVANMIRENQSNVTVLQMQLKNLLHADFVPDVSDDQINQLLAINIPDTSNYKLNPSYSFMRQQVEVAESEKRLQASKAAPDLLVGFFSQTLIGTVNSSDGTVATASDRFTGFQVGVSLPIWFVSHHARTKASMFNVQAAESKLNTYERSLQHELLQASAKYFTQKTSIEYYQNSALPNSELMLSHASLNFKNGEIGYAEYLMGVKNALSVQERYLTTLNDLNQTLIYIEFLTGKK